MAQVIQGESYLLAVLGRDQHTRHAWFADYVLAHVAAQLLGCLAFAFAYAKSYEREGSGLGQGIRFGLVIAILIDGFATVWNVVTQPIAVRLGVLELIARVAEFGIYGAIVGLVYQPDRPKLPEGVSEQYDLRG